MFGSSYSAIQLFQYVITSDVTHLHYNSIALPLSSVVGITNIATHTRLFTTYYPSSYTSSILSCTNGCQNVSFE